MQLMQLVGAAGAAGAGALLVTHAIDVAIPHSVCNQLGI
jgi:hypothetical protein